MLPRCKLPRRSERLEHNQCHGPFNFFPPFFLGFFLPGSAASRFPVAPRSKVALASCRLSRGVPPAVPPKSPIPPVSISGTNNNPPYKIDRKSTRLNSSHL